MSPINRFTKFIVQGLFGAPPGSDNWEIVETPILSTPVYSGNGHWGCIPINSCLTSFNLLTAAAAAATADPYTLSLGTGTEVIARATKGGENIKTQASTPADADNAMLIPAANSAGYSAIAAQTQPRLRTRVNLTQITAIVFGAGLDQNVTSPILTSTSGDGAGLMFDPLNKSVTGLPAASLPNWILVQKINGTNTFADSGVAVVAGVDYELEVRYGPDNIPVYYINGTLIANASAAAGTATTVLGFVVGVQKNGSDGATQKDFDCRYILAGRQQIG